MSLCRAFLLQRKRRAREDQAEKPARAWVLPLCPEGGWKHVPEASRRAMAGDRPGRSGRNSEMMLRLDHGLDVRGGMKPHGTCQGVHNRRMGLSSPEMGAVGEAGSEENV